MTPVREPHAMISGMDPVLRPDAFVFVTSDDPALCQHAIASFREDEGQSLILPEGIARQAGLPCDLPMAWITLRVVSALDGVGLTAAVSTVLAEAGIACNVVAGRHHDHLFVPKDRAQEAVALLRERAAAEGRAS
ncbi:ACT domain-containing protein [Aestuariibius sp. 2305UL40-4]|uniref:ACT domain-containing protein n=1 Tax=Aestuariibius violaceus TaxID=3234132 RepID=UPI00345E3D75